MKTLILVALMALFTFAAAEAQTKKYDIKSGIVTFETIMKMSGMEIKTKSIVYFDDYGMKECKETYEEDALKESFFSDGKNLYKVIFGNKTAYKVGVPYRGTEMRFDWKDISDKDKKAGKARQLPDTTVAGKKCQSFEYSDRGTATKYAGWSHICLLINLTSKDMSSVTRAVKVEENAKVSPEKFAVPVGFAVK